MERCVLNVLVTIPASSHERPASRALHGPGRRCTRAARRADPCKTAPAACRRPQELEQDSDEVVTPRPETQHCGHEQNKIENLGKRDD